jgi:hypothetical protein
VAGPGPLPKAGRRARGVTAITECSWRDGQRADHAKRGNIFSLTGDGEGESVDAERGTGLVLSKVTFLALLLPAMIWAFGHSTYPVFPVYFRGIKLTIAGLIFG